jgi:hypothetical protein
MREIARGMRLAGLVLLLGASGAVSLLGQDPRDATVARAFREFDTSRRLQMLISILNPTYGPPRGAWSVGVQLLAQTLLEEGRDSAAAVWLRWAIRLSPEMQPDTVLFLPEVVAAYRSAREYVGSTTGPADSFAATSWLWGAQAGGDPAGRLQIVAAGQAPVRVAVRGIGRVVPGGSIPFKPGSYQISAAGSGYDSLRVVTREILPGVTTVLELRARPAAAQVATKPPPPVRSSRKKKGFPVVWAGLGAAGAVALVAVLAGNSGAAPEPTGGVIITIPSP